MFRTKAETHAHGNWQLKAACTKGHTVFKDQMHPSGPYRCPFCDADVN